MKKFNIFAQNIHGLIQYTVEKGKVKSLHDKTLVDTVRSLTDKSAIKVFYVRVENKLVVVPEIKMAGGHPNRQNRSTENIANKNFSMAPSLFDKELPENIVIFTDFNGVLDDHTRRSNESNLVFRIPKLACPEKVFMICKLALKHNAKIVFISLWRKHSVSMKVIIARSLRQSDNPEHVEFFNDNRRALSQLSRDSTECLGSMGRSREVQLYVEENNVTKCVVFEDEHPISEMLNPIMTSSFTGLEVSHIERAEVVLSA
jgi:hypothetical protein